MSISRINYKPTKGRSREDQLGFVIIQAGNDGCLKKESSSGGSESGLGW